MLHLHSSQMRCQIAQILIWVLDSSVQQVLMFYLLDSLNSSLMAELCDYISISIYLKRIMLL